MTLRAAHGRAAELGALVVVETLPADELPAGVPGPTRPAANRNEAGEFTSGPGTAAVASSGGKAAAESRQIAQLLGLWEPPDGHAYAPYTRMAREHREAHADALADSVGGGKLSRGVMSILASASLALAASRFLYDRGAETGDAALLGQAARLASESRTALLTAHELAAREAAGRPQRATDTPWLVAAPTSPAKRPAPSTPTPSATPAGDAPAGQPDVTTAEAGKDPIP